jgi:3-hydroxybutyryl-CoA dehydrogenase
MNADDIKTVGIAGGGVMGGGIAMTFAQSGYTTIVLDISEEQLARTQEAIGRGRFGWDGAVERGRYTRQEVDQFLARLSFTIDTSALAPVDLVIEAVPEDLELKRKVWAELDTVVQPGAVFASNTSGFDITSLNQAVERRDRFIGMHWFSPANIMKLVELIYAPDTSTETLELMEQICSRIGKTSVRVKDAPGSYGFVANRIYYAAVAEARKIVESGIASAEDVDTAMKLGYNWPAGPLEMFRGARSGWQ